MMYCISTDPLVIDQARRRLHHPDAMPWWYRVAECGDKRLLWCRSGGESDPGIISIQRFYDGRWHYDGIVPPLFGALDEQWANGLELIR